MPNSRNSPIEIVRLSSNDELIMTILPWTSGRHGRKSVSFLFTLDVTYAHVRTGFGVDVLITTLLKCSTAVNKIND